jgi:glycosyltransferase involved in cell wall biosynthesis
MPRHTVGLLSDLAWNEGIGRYGVYLQRLLQPEFELHLVFFNYQTRCLELTSGGLTQTAARTIRLPLIDSKPWFWQRLRGAVPRYDLLHIISQNLSFLVPRDGRALVTCHDIAPLFIPERPWTRWARRRLYSGLPRARMVMADSVATGHDLVREFAMALARIRVVPLGVDASAFHPLDRRESRARLGLPPESRIVLNVGIDKWRKNIAGLVKAFAQLAQRIPDPLLVRVGQPSQETVRLIRSLGLEAKVRHVAACSDQDLIHFYNAADVFAFPSFYEGFGLPALEAMACGTPVVASDRTSVPEVVGDAGILVNPDDTSALAMQLERVLADPALGQELSRRGLARAKEFTWEKTARAVAQVYRDFMSS